MEPLNVGQKTYIHQQSVKMIQQSGGKEFLLLSSVL